MTGVERTRQSTRGLAVTIVVSLLVASIIALFVPWRTPTYRSQPHPATSYTEAVRRIQELDSNHSAGMNPLCRVQVMTHGEKTERAIVLVHGYTNCPQQFQALGQQFFGLGYNVLIAPLPHHGLADRLTDEISLLTANDLAAYADQVVDIAGGLGDKVDMAGISAGGVVTSWAAQNRSDLRLAIVISPAFGFQQIPTALTAPETNLVSILPETYPWWDPELQMKTDPPYAYPRYSLHGLAQIVGLGFGVQMAAHRERPKAGSILVVTNGAEPSVNNVLTREVAGNWRARGAIVATYEFSATLQLPHDLIDPNQDGARTDLVYPKLLELVQQHR